MSTDERPNSRRKFLQMSSLLTLAGCNYSGGEKTDAILSKFQKFNDWFQSKIFDQDKMAPEYADDELTPESGFKVNGHGIDEPEFDMEHWGLEVSGMVKNPGIYTMEQIKSLPKKEMNTRFVCVEGWSMIPKWGGTPLKGFLEMIGADMKAPYLYVECADEYYCSYDMPSMLHAQTLLCYEAYGKPLALKHGAPVRLVVPTKLGYKQSKWLMKLEITDTKRIGYWEDQGYDWFGGV